MATKKELDELRTRFADAIAKYGNVHALEFDETEDGPERLCIVREPRRTELSRLTKEMTGDSLKAMRNLLFSCLLDPEADELKELFERSPGLAVALGNRLLTIARVNEEILDTRL